jgi:hypothetical protein
LAALYLAAESQAFKRRAKLRSPAMQYVARRNR